MSEDNRFEQELAVGSGERVVLDWPRTQEQLRMTASRDSAGALTVRLTKLENKYRIAWEVVVRLIEQIPMRPYSDEEFNRLVNEGALSHPVAPLRLSRAYVALRYLVDAVPGAADALRRWADQRDEQDAAAANEDPSWDPDARNWRPG